jgi:hypothetical protein
MKHKTNDYCVREVKSLYFHNGILKKISVHKISNVPPVSNATLRPTQNVLRGSGLELLVL